MKHCCACSNYEGSATVEQDNEEKGGGGPQRQVSHLIKLLEQHAVVAEGHCDLGANIVQHS